MRFPVDKRVEHRLGSPDGEALYFPTQQRGLAFAEVVLAATVVQLLQNGEGVVVEVVGAEQVDKGQEVRDTAVDGCRGEEQDVLSPGVTQACCALRGGGEEVVGLIDGEDLGAGDLIHLRSGAVGTGSAEQPVGHSSQRQVTLQRLPLPRRLDRWRTDDDGQPVSVRAAGAAQALLDRSGDVGSCSRLAGPGCVGDQYTADVFDDPHGLCDPGAL